MRATSPGRALPFVWACLLGIACANRGMHAPTDGGPSGGGGRGGGSATGGNGGTGSMDAGCAAPIPHDGGASCTAKYNFEAGVQGAVIAATGQGAFSAVAVSGGQTFCGAGALAITASFNGMAGINTKGVVEIPVAAADRNFTGKTLTVHFMAVPGCSADLGIAIALQTDSGDKIVLPTFRPVTSTWKTEIVTLEADAGVVGMDTVRGISVQAFSSSGYEGTIYVDEVSVTGP
jgi:hypothetical protein